MKLKQQLVLLMMLALLIPTITITSIAIYNIRSKALKEIEQYRIDEFEKLKIYLKHLTDIAYGIIEAQHKTLKLDARYDTLTPAEIQQWMAEYSLQEISEVRFDKGEGYFWVTDNALPYPTMIMHAEKRDMKGVVLSDPSNNVEKYASRNIYQVRAEMVNKNGDAFVEYIMKKPGTSEIINKISYSRLYPSLNWVISTGLYTDQIETAVDAKETALNDQIRNMVISIVLVGLAIILIAAGVTYFFSAKLTNAIVSIKNILNNLSLGEQVSVLQTARKDEIGDMTNSLNQLVIGLKSYTSFAKEIGEGNLQQAFTPLSDADILGNELLSMRDNLKLASDEKEIRDWVNEGQAKLGDVLRSNNTDTQMLADEILRSLIHYVGANQGGIFILHKGDTLKSSWLDLMAAYAYDRKKFLTKRIEVGEGLVGQAALERATIYLKEIPEAYISITSGLGGANPKAIIIVPLMYNDQVYGILELASFREYKPYEVSFIEKIAESIASTLATVQINEHTKNLLEQSQQMTEELRAQEEEVRQNMEELSATQEQMKRQLDENVRIHNEYKIREEVTALTTLLSESDLFGNITNMNAKLCQVSKYTREELLNQPHSIFRHADMPQALFRILWDTLKQGRVFNGIIKNRAKDGSVYWVDATIVPVRNEDGSVMKYVGASYHIPHEDIAVALYNEQAIRLHLPLITDNGIQRLDQVSVATDSYEMQPS
jgi:PAS domain S-box-containing protein